MDRLALRQDESLEVGTKSVISSRELIINNSMVKRV